MCNNNNPIQPTAPPRPRNPKNLKLIKHNIPKPNNKLKKTGDEFIKESKILLEKIYNGLIHLEKINKDSNTKIKLHINENKSNLTITIQELGTYVINCDYKINEIYLFSPVSTTQIYMCSFDNNWISINDGHNIIQLLSTEINAHCQGYPNF